MLDLTPLTALPIEFWEKWQAQLHQPQPHLEGSFHLVGIRKTEPKTWEELKIIVLVVDENGFPIPGVKVAFSYSTANRYQVGPDYTWQPPRPFRADVVPTEGSGQIEHVQGSTIPENSIDPGGVTVYIADPEYSSAYVEGCGALWDHTGMHMIFQLRRKNVVPLSERLEIIERRLKAVEDAFKTQPE